MMQTTIPNNMQKCNLAQVTLLRKIAIETYQQTFADSNSEALLQKYYQESLNIKLLSTQLQNPESEFYFIYSAPISNETAEIAGFLKLNVGSAQTDLADPDALEVEKIYLLQEFLGEGLGHQLINFAVARAEQQNKQYLWLGVWEDNQPALKFYNKMGFFKFGEHGFDMGGDIQTDYLLKKRLN
ncbi:N-acetyltransferase [Psychromonas sp. 14N.309.X.WAT.B.A12]|jgi:diamine N-acetyltransferase|uniref:GNAT family N-acetyltransferase n=2 Tax=Psychromonas TaxID=67572 RepID=UPI0025B0F870|nr:GNAT family N-acetyltransferase [Psychromonas sp. 14N.309.X.WAT.B.A12]